MATKTLYNNPTVNPFELLQVEEQPAEKRAKPAQAKKAGESALLETPAERGQRRAKAKAEKDKQQEEVKKQQQKEAAMATLLGPLDGFQVQKGSQPKKPSEVEKKKTLNRAEYEVLSEKPTSSEPRKFQNKAGKTPYQPRDGSNPRQFRGDQQDKRRPPRDTQGENISRPPRHEGFDKHSGGKTPNKHISKREGQGGGNWGDAVQDWNQQKTTEATPLSGAGWDDNAQAQPTEGEAKSKETTSDAAPKEPEADEKAKDDTSAAPRQPAWDEVEGHGKMLLDEYQTTVAAQKAKALADLAGVKQTRTVETPVDLSKFSHKEVTDEKEKKEKKAEKKKQQRSGQTQVDVADVFSVRTRGGAGGRGRGGAAGRGRVPRAGQPEGEKAEKQQEGDARRGEHRGGRGGPRGPHNVVPKGPQQFPGLSAPKTASK